jgi:hypothetical protein
MAFRDHRRRDRGRDRLFRQTGDLKEACVTVKVSKLKRSQFGLPGKRKYPMPDREHAINAKGRAKQQLKRGKLSRSAYEKIVAKANGILDGKKSTKKSRKKSAKRDR